MRKKEEAQPALAEEEAKLQALAAEEAELAAFEEELENPRKFLHRMMKEINDVRVSRIKSGDLKSHLKRTDLSLPIALANMLVLDQKLKKIIGGKEESAGFNDVIQKLKGVLNERKLDSALAEGGEGEALDDSPGED